MSNQLLKKLHLTGLEAAPSQVCGAIRLVPLVRSVVQGDLRLTLRSYTEDFGIVKVPGAFYGSYVPHGMILTWSEDGRDAYAAHGAQLRSHAENDTNTRDLWTGVSLRYFERMAKRESPNTLRFLPLHTAMEGFLQLFFKGPTIAWADYSNRALRDGLSPRVEWSAQGASIAGLDRALRVFEIADNQVGVLVFVADALASAFVVSHPDDYRRLHPSLMQDFYGELIWQYALMYQEIGPQSAKMNDLLVQSVDDLGRGLAGMRANWADHAKRLAQGIYARPVTSGQVYQAGPFSLRRFITDLDPEWENHIGEAIVRDKTGEVEYLKTFRLSAAQTRRTYLLKVLSEHDWRLEEAAKALNSNKHDLVRRIENNGFGFLLDHNLRVEANRGDRKPRRRS